MQALSSGRMSAKRAVMLRMAAAAARSLVGAALSLSVISLACAGPARRARDGSTVGKAVPP